MRRGAFFILVIFIIFLNSAVRIFGDFIYRVDFTSRYIWRGFDLNPTNQPAIQPSFEYSCGSCGVTFNIWSSISFSDKDNNEIDLSFTYDFHISEHFSVAAGITHYGWYFVDHFSFARDSTQEIFLSTAFPNLFFHPKLTVFYDFGNGDGIYVLLETIVTRKFSSSIEACFLASLGYNGGQWLTDEMGSGFSDLNFGMDWLFTFRKFTISPFIRYTFVLLENIGDQNHFWFGISFRYQ